MGVGKKFENAAEEAKGKAKEAFGDATDNERLEAEGKFDQAGAKAKQGVEHLKDDLNQKVGETLDPPERTD